MKERRKQTVFELQSCLVYEPSFERKICRFERRGNLPQQFSTGNETLVAFLGSFAME